MKFLELEGVRFNREPGDEANEVTEVGSGNFTPGDSIPVAES